MHILIVAALFIFVSCSATKSSPTKEISEIRWGTSFGMCRGYCYTEYQYTPDGTRLVKKGWDTTMYPQTIEVFSSKAGEWTELISNINLSAFDSLPERIGCPDCADGGAEWLEIITTEGSKKVTYEYGQVPEVLEQILPLLRR